MALMDSAADRLDLRFTERVEAVRIGTVAAHDRSAARKWRSMKQRSQPAPQLGDAELEAAIRHIATQFPDNVIHEVRPA